MTLKKSPNKISKKTNLPNLSSERAPAAVNNKRAGSGKKSYTAQLEKMAEFLSINNNFAIICHVNPDGDAIGSAYALAGVLEIFGKSCVVDCDGEFPAVFDMLKRGLKLECKRAEKIITVDTAAISQWGRLWEKYGRCDAAIDHHETHENYSELSLISDACAAAVIVYDLAKKLKVKMTQQIANCIYTGVATDTGCFKYLNTDKKAHEIAVKAMTAGAQTKLINRLMFETRSHGEVRLLGNIINNMEYHYGKKIAVAVVTKKMREETGFFNDDLGEMASVPCQIEGVVFGITLKQLEDTKYKISIRTNSGGSAKTLAKKHGGGGHENAAGCTVFGSLEQVKKELVRGASRLIAGKPL